jgi:hypothetical protein
MLPRLPRTLERYRNVETWVSPSARPLVARTVQAVIDPNAAHVRECVCARDFSCCNPLLAMRFAHVCLSCVLEQRAEIITIATASLDNVRRGTRLPRLMAPLRATLFRWLVQTIAVLALVSGTGRAWSAPTASQESAAFSTSEPRSVHGEKAASHEQATPRVARAPLLGRLPPVLPGPLFVPSRSATARGLTVSDIGPSRAGREVFFFVRRRIPRMGSEEPPSVA